MVSWIFFSVYNDFNGTNNFTRFLNFTYSFNEVNDTHRENSVIQYNSLCFIYAASDLFHVYTNNVYQTFHYHGY